MKMTNAEVHDIPFEMTNAEVRRGHGVIGSKAHAAQQTRTASGSSLGAKPVPRNKKTSPTLYTLSPLFLAVVAVVAVAAAVPFSAFMVWFGLASPSSWP
jgi:hypothetical protein